MTTWSGEIKDERMGQEDPAKASQKSKKKSILLLTGLILGIIILAFVIIFSMSRGADKRLEYQKESTSGDFIIDKRDNQRYNTVTIGNQVWMAENLKTTRFNDGTNIPLVKNNTKWNNLRTPAYCWYKNSRNTYRETYGALYNWYAVNTGELCPTGWHVPAATEWKQLTEFMGDSISWVREVAGIKLKEAGNAHWKFNDSISSTNEFGFTALPGGTRTIYGVFFGIGEEGTWWSSSEDVHSKGDARNWEMESIYNSVIEIQQYKQTGMSVRCIKD
jgi:uncharacterized protein (TIGR02145 family)